MSPQREPAADSQTKDGTAQAGSGRASDQAAGRATRRMKLLLRALLRPGPRQTELITEDGDQSYRPIDLKLIRRLMGFLKPYRRRYALGICLGVIMVPEYTANFAWGDADACSLYITASTSLYRIRTRIPGRLQMI